MSIFCCKVGLLVGTWQAMLVILQQCEASNHAYLQSCFTCCNISDFCNYAACDDHSCKFCILKFKLQKLLKSVKIKCETFQRTHNKSWLKINYVTEIFLFANKHSVYFTKNADKKVERLFRNSFC